MKKVLISIDKDCTGTQKRLYELFMLWCSIDAQTKGTWCALFKTEGYKKSCETRKKIREHIKFFLRKAFPCAKSWKITFAGSKNTGDVQLKRRQSYILWLYYDTE